MGVHRVGALQLQLGDRVHEEVDAHSDENGQERRRDQVEMAQLELHRAKGPSHAAAKRRLPVVDQTVAVVIDAVARLGPRHDRTDEDPQWTLDGTGDPLMKRFDAGLPTLVRLRESLSQLSSDAFELRAGGE